MELIIFDLDGTLVERDTDVLLPGVRAWFDIHRADYQFAIATNQGGVGLRYWLEQMGMQANQYPNEMAARTHVLLAQMALRDVSFAVYIAFAYRSKKTQQWAPIPPGKEDDPEWSPGWRKPNPGMLLAAMAGHDPVACLFVGDSDDDRLAAEAAGCPFQFADDFFGRTATGQ